jgi:uncharacterized membrane protein
VVLADWGFTTPAVIVQPLSGWLLMERLRIDVDQSWIAAAIVLYLGAGSCWLPVVAIQIRVRDLAVAAAATRTPLSPQCNRPMRMYCRVPDISGTRH